MRHRHRAPEQPSDEPMCRKQGKTVLVDSTQWTAPASLDRSGLCGITQCVHGVCDVRWQQERQR